MTITRMSPLDRRAQILACALDEAKRVGYMNVDRGHISRRLDISRGTITRYFGALPHLRAAIMRAAITQGCVQVVAQGLAARDPLAQAAPERIRQLAIASLQ